MNIIGITGSSGAGKSTVCKVLEKYYNVKVINADDIARRLSKKGTKYVEEIVRKFGKEILDEYGEIKRKELARIIYNDLKKRNELNQCTFKYIKKEIEKEIDNYKDQEVTIVIDAPLLYECELNVLCNHVIGIISTRNLQLERIVARDNVGYEHAEMRLNAQESNDFYISKCDKIIENNNDIAYIENNIYEIAKVYNITKKLQ